MYKKNLPGLSMGWPAVSIAWWFIGSGERPGLEGTFGNRLANSELEPSREGLREDDMGSQEASVETELPRKNWGKKFLIYTLQKSATTPQPFLIARTPVDAVWRPCWQSRAADTIVNGQPMLTWRPCCQKCRLLKLSIITGINPVEWTRRDAWVKKLWFLRERRWLHELSWP